MFEHPVVSVLPKKQTVAAKIFDMKYGIPEFC